MKGHSLRLFALSVIMALIISSSLIFPPQILKTSNNELTDTETYFPPTPGLPRGTRAGNSWPMHRADLLHSGFSTSSAPNNNSILWTNTTGNGDAYGSPVVEDGKVFIGSRDGYLYCFDLNTGERLWRTFLSSADFGIPATPAVANDHVVVFCSGNDAVYRLRVSDGGINWSFNPTGGGAYGGSSPAINNGRIYVGSGNGTFYCLNEITGNIIWTYTTGIGPVRPYGIQSSPAVANGRVFIGSCDTYLYCINETQPGPIADYFWRTNLFDAIFGSAAVANGRVYCGSGYYNYGEGTGSHTMFCLDELTGAVIWSYATGSDILSSPAIAYGNCYFTSTDGNLYCVDAMSAGPTPTLYWSNTTGDTWSSPAVSDGKVIVGSIGTNRLYCFNASTGTLIWDYNAGNDIYSSPAIGEGKVVVSVRGNPELVYCFGSSIPIVVDSLIIEDDSHNELTTVDLNIGESVTAYAAGYNSTTSSFVEYVEVNWAGSGGTWSPNTGTSSIFTAGFSGGLYTQTGDNLTLGLSDDFNVNIRPPTLDYILITDSPNGTELTTVTLPIGETVIAFASGYNYTGPTYVGLYSVDWIEAGGTWFPNTGASSTFTAGTFGGLYTQTGQNIILGVLDTFEIDIMDPTLDYILITDSEDGTPLDTITLPLGGSVTAYASGYNITGPTYIGLVDVSWGGPGGSWMPGTGTSSTFTAGFTPGFYPLTGENLSLGVNDSFNIDIINFTLDFILITDSPNGTELGTIILPIGGTVTAYASGYNDTGPTFVGLVEVNWSGSGGIWSPITGKSSIFTAGGIAGFYSQTGQNLTLGVTDNFEVEITDWIADFIIITDSPNGTDLSIVSLPIGGTVTAYASGYNITASTFVGLIVVNWTGVGGNWFPITGSSSTFTAGFVAGLYGQTAENTTLNVSDTFDVDIQQPTLDYIEITDIPNGTPLGMVIMPLGGTVKAYASGYNSTGPTYIGLIEVNWTGIGGIWLSGTGTNSTFTGGTSAGLYVQIGENTTLDVQDTFNVDIINATLDYIVITDNPDGTPLATVILPIGGEVRAYASGYNYTGPTYVGLIEVNWTGSGGFWSLSTSTNSIFTAGFIDGFYTQTGENALIYYDTFMVEIIKGTLDYINITDSPDGTPLDTVSLPIRGDITAYASGYNHTGPTYVGLIEVNWVGSGGIWSTTTNTSSIFTAGFVGGSFTLTGQNLSLNVFDTFNVFVQPPTMDYIEISDMLFGTPLDIVELPVGGEVTVYALGYNLTGPTYVSLVEVVWSQSNLLGSFSTSQGSSTTFTAGMSGGTAIINCSNSSLSLNANFTLIVKEPTVDYIQIRDSSGGQGDVVVDITFTLGEMVTGTYYCAAYNHTAGYLGDREVDWEITGGVGTISPITGLSTNFTASNSGNGTIIANLTGIINSTGIITVNPAEVSEFPPATPSNFTVEAKDSDKIKIEWSPNTESDLAGYIIQRSMGPNGPWHNVTTLGIETTSYTDTGLEPGTTYYYRIIAFDNASKESPPSLARSATTTKQGEFPWIWILILIIVVVILILVFVMFKKRKPEETPFKPEVEKKAIPPPPSWMVGKEEETTPGKKEMPPEGEIPEEKSPLTEDEEILEDELPPPED